MSRRLLSIGSAAVATALAASAPAVLAQEPAEITPAAMHEVAANELAWEDIEVPGFLSGMQIAPVHGDPSVADEPYALRLLLPDGYDFPPHFHPRDENVTVLEGTLLLAMGEEFDEAKLSTYAPGDYLYLPAENPHYGGAKGRTVLQLHGFGPFEITVVEGQEMSQ